MPGRYGERRRYVRLARCDVVPLAETYGFSTGLRSIARPYECSDQRFVPSTKRQLNADVLSASIERKSLAPYASTGTIRLIGKRAANRRRSTATTSAAASRWTTSRPVWARPSNPQCVARTSRRSPSGTGHPVRHETPVIVSRRDGGSVLTDDRKGAV